MKGGALQALSFVALLSVVAGSSWHTLAKNLIPRPCPQTCPAECGHLNTGGLYLLATMLGLYAAGLAFIWYILQPDYGSQAVQTERPQQEQCAIQTDPIILRTNSQVEMMVEDATRQTAAEYETDLVELELDKRRDIAAQAQAVQVAVTAAREECERDKKLAVEAARREATAIAIGRVRTVADIEASAAKRIAIADATAAAAAERVEAAEEVAAAHAAALEESSREAARRISEVEEDAARRIGEAETAAKETAAELKIKEAEMERRSSIDALDARRSTIEAVAVARQAFNEEKAAAVSAAVAEAREDMRKEAEPRLIDGDQADASQKSSSAENSAAAAAEAKLAATQAAVAAAAKDAAKREADAKAGWQTAVVQLEAAHTELTHVKESSQREITEAKNQTRLAKLEAAQAGAMISEAKHTWQAMQEHAVEAKEAWAAKVSALDSLTPESKKSMRPDSMPAHRRKSKEDDGAVGRTVTPDLTASPEDRPGSAIESQRRWLSEHDRTDSFDTPSRAANLRRADAFARGKSHPRLQRVKSWSPRENTSFL